MRSRRRLSVVCAAACLALVGIVLPNGTALTPLAAATGGCRVRNTATHVSYRNLQWAINQAAPGTLLRVTGTCVGNFRVGKDLTIRRGSAPASLVGDGRTTLTVTTGRLRLGGLLITGGRGSACAFLASYTCGGGIVNGGHLTLTRSIVVLNVAHGVEGALGGGIYNDRGATLTVRDSTVSENRAEGGLPDGDGTGGGIYNRQGTVTLIGSVVRWNVAVSAPGGGGAGGGGLVNDGDGVLTVIDSTVTGNNATADSGGATGGGIVNGGTLTIAGSTLSGNTVVSETGQASGGGIANAMTLSLTDTTLSGNRVVSGGRFARGGGIANNGGALTLTAVTISANRALSSNGTALAHGGGLHHQGSAGATVVSTIIAANTATTAGPDCHLDKAGNDAVQFTSGGHNLVGQGDGCFGFEDGVKHDQVGSLAAPLHPMLGRLAHNGGPTDTQALLTGSPAIDAAGAAPCATPTDQRGVSRPRGAACDIGAFERR